MIFKRLPSLEILEKLNFYSVLIGFILLTISILIGFIWLPIAFPKISYVDPKLISVSIVWLVFGIGILTKLIANGMVKSYIIFINWFCDCNTFTFGFKRICPNFSFVLLIFFKFYFVMNLIGISINHRTSTIEQREAVHLSLEEQQNLFRYLKTNC